MGKKRRKNTKGATKQSASDLDTVDGSCADENSQNQQNNATETKTKSSIIDSQINFVYSAINDTVGTIRALDIKSQILLGLCVLPIAKIEYILTKAEHFRDFIEQRSEFACVVFFTTCIFVLIIGLVLMLYSTMKVVYARFEYPQKAKCEENKSACQNEERKCKLSTNGSFFSPGRVAKHNYGFVCEAVDSYPQCKEAILTELAYEHVLLCRIRDRKRYWLSIVLYCFSAVFISASLIVSGLLLLRFDFSI